MNYYLQQDAEQKLPGAHYGQLTLTGGMPNLPPSYIVDWTLREETDQMVIDLDRILTDGLDELLLVIPRWFGKYLCENHPAFMPKQIEEI